MNHPHSGYLANYNSLTDKHLAGYFSNTRIRRHLLRSGLITRTGRIISEKEYRLNAMKKDHQKFIRECLAQAIFHKVLDMERHHQVEIKRKLENSARKERVQRIKVERAKRSAEDNHLLLYPHPPTAPRNRYGRHKLGDRGQSSHLTTYPRPSTAPGNIQHPVRLQPLYNNATTESTPKATSSSRPKFSTYEKEHHFASGGERGVSRPMYSMEYSSGISPYRLPIINNYVIPIAPQPPTKSEKNINVMKSGTSRGRRFRPTTVPNGLEQLLMKDTGKFYKPQLHSNAYVTMIYLGKTVHLSYDLFDYRDEIKIYQQHCGGENVCVYKGKLLEGETFQFVSKRHHGFPFSLTFYLNGIQVDRLSSCCEYKHRKGARLGGKHGHFGFVNVERSSPCYRCIIAMGLDKKPSPPKKKTDDAEENKADSIKEELNHKIRESSSSSSSRREENKDALSLSSTISEEGKEFAEDTMDVEARKKDIKKDDDLCERNQGSPADNAYDEDFEADEEKSDEKVNEEGQTDDQMNGMSKSPSDDEKDNLDHEKESKNSSQKALQASDSERDESDGYSESDSEEDKQGKGKAADLEMAAAARKIQSFYRKHRGRRQTHRVKPDRKCVPSLSSSSTLYSSENDSQGETRKQDHERNTDIHSECENETAEIQREEGQETDVEEEEEMGEAENTTDKHVPGPFHEKTMEMVTPVTEKFKAVEIIDMNQGEEEMLVQLEGKTLAAECRKQEPSEDEEDGDCKSVKEKIAEAIENDNLLSSEPEPSDSSTEDEEENIAATPDKHEVPDGASLAEDSNVLESQKVAEQVEQERQMVGKERALEEEELMDEEGPPKAALEEELPAKNVAPLTVEQAVKNELVTKETELDLEMDSVEKDVREEEEEKSSQGNGEGEDDSKELKETSSEDVVTKGEELLGGCQLEGDKVENQHFTEALMVNMEVPKEEEGADEAVEMLGTEELVEKKATEADVHEAKEVIGDIIEVDKAPGTPFMDGEEEAAEILGSRELVEKKAMREEVHEAKEVIEEGVGVTEALVTPIVKAEEDTEEAAEILRPREKKTTEEEMHELKEVLEEAVEVDEELVSQFVKSDTEEEALKTVEKAEPEGHKTLQEREHEVDAVEKVNTVENGTMEDMFLKGNECVEEGKEVNIELRNASIVEAEPTVPKTTAADVSIDEKATALEESTDNGSGLTGEVLFGVEKIVQNIPVMCEEELVKTSSEVSQMKYISIEEDSAQDKLETWAEEPLQSETEGSISATEENKGQEATVKTEEEEEEESTNELNAEREATLQDIVVLKETAQEEENVMQAVEREAGDREGMLISEIPVPEIEKEEPSTEEPNEEAPGTITLVTEEMTRKVESEGKKVDANKTEEKVVVKCKVESEDLEAEGEMVSVDTGPQGVFDSEVTIWERQAMIGEMGAETTQVPESSAPKEVLGGGELNQEKRMESEASPQDELETASEETAVEKTLMNVGMKVMEEESEVEGLAEEMSSHEDPMREELFADAIARERQIALSDKTETRGTEENVEEGHFKEKDVQENRKTEGGGGGGGGGRGGGETENLSAIPLHAQWSEREQQHEISAQMIIPEPAGASDFEDRH